MFAVTVDEDERRYGFTPVTDPPQGLGSDIFRTRALPSPLTMAFLGNSTSGDRILGYPDGAIDDFSLLLGQGDRRYRIVADAAGNLGVESPSTQ